MLNSKAEVSLDAPTSSGETNHTLLNSLFDSREGAQQSLERDEWLQILAKELPVFQKGLNDKEKMVLNTRLLAEEPLTLQEVADEFGLTRERVRQIESKLIEKLRLQLQPYLTMK